MKLLSHHSIPAWMLADSLIVLSAVGCVLSLVVLLPSTSKQQLLVHNSQLAADLKKIREANAMLTAEKESTDRGHLEAIKRLSQENAALADYQKKAVDWIAWAEKEIAGQAKSAQAEKRLRRELLNLKGDFSKVTFVIDISGSMGAKPAKDMPRANWAKDGEPWTYVQNQMASWLQNLPVDSFRLVCFNHEVTEFPADQQEWLSGDQGRRRATEFLSKLKATGGTNTELALQTAQSRAPSAIVLFTDGSPSKVNNKTFEFDPSQVSRIVAHVKQAKHKIPINVVAVNNYFSDELGSFLHNLASASGGGFIGL
jgi:Mg-chelatase subunit ChlD